MPDNPSFDSDELNPVTHALGRQGHADMLRKAADQLDPPLVCPALAAGITCDDIPYLWHCTLPVGHFREGHRPHEAWAQFDDDDVLLWRWNNDAV